MADIGPFEVLEKLGAGGMGEVFKARDRRLNRFVALKFLPESAPAAARERFQREAQAIAALNHPHICTLYEIGEEQGRPYLVLELLEGESLYQRLARGAVPAAQIAQWGAEIADALHAAHAKGILHRDLKPGNIFVTPRGSVKVLDFGLAQFAAAAAPDADAPTFAGTALSPGLQPLTTPGALLGTYAYMSPEQARGEASDARSDLFSLGVVLYEMAAGQLPFQGRTTADLSAAILTRTPPPASALRPPGSGEVPARLDDTIAQCLEKDPELRYQSAADLRVSLRRLSGSGSASSLGSTLGAPSSSVGGPTPDPAITTQGSAPPTPVAPSGASSRRGWLLPAAAAVVVLAGGLAYWRLRPGAAPTAPLQFRQLTFSGHIVDAVISPDGKFLAHVDKGPDGTSLHLQAVANGSDTQIMPPAAGCCQSPSFAPDGSQVYFMERRSLKAVPVLGGAVRTITSSVCSGAGFSPDGSQIAYIASDNPTSTTSRADLWIAHADGSQARMLHQAAAGEGYLSQCWSNFDGPMHAPAWSPDGRWIAVEQGGASGEARLMLVNSADGHAQPLGPPFTSNPTDMNWLANGQGLVMTASIPDAASSQLWQVAYPSGQMTQLTNDLQGYASASLASTGALALVHAAPQASIWVQTKAGGEFQQLPGGGADQDGDDGGLDWTPQGGEGGLISLRRFGNQFQLWAEASDGSGAHEVANVPQNAYAVHVAPNGQIIFGVGGATATVWRINGDGSGLAQLMPLPAGASAYNPSLALGGQEAVYMLVAANGEQKLWGVPLSGGEARPLWTGDIFASDEPASPDGTRVLVIAEASKKAQPVILRLGGTPPTSQEVTTVVDPGGARRPLGWTPDGRAITFVRQQGTTDNIWAQPIAGGAAYALTHFTDLNIGAYRFSRDGRLAVSRGSENRDVVIAVKQPTAGN